MTNKSAFTSITNIIYFFRFFVKGRIIPGFKAGKKDLVIDVGCGDKPFWRADVFLDKLSLGNEQRFSGTSVVAYLGVFVDSDITKTSFKSKVFDYSYCSHLLEHVERPDLAIKEIMRISKRGYIEVPDGFIEFIWPYQSHLWFIFFQKDTLVFLRKGITMSTVLKTNGTKYLYLGRRMKDPFIRLYWKKKIKYRIVDDVSKKDQYVSTKNDDAHLQPHYVQSMFLFLTKILRLFFYKRKEIGNLMN